MSDAFSRVFMYLFGILCLFVTPLLFILNNNDIATRAYIDNKVSVFVDEVRASGRISPVKYQQFLNDLNGTGQVYDVDILHRTEVMIPQYDSSGNTTGAYETTYRYHNTEDIYDDMYPAGKDPTDYSMKPGDFLQVKVRSREYSVGSSLFGAITGDGRGLRISASSAGYIGG